MIILKKNYGQSMDKKRKSQKNTSVIFLLAGFGKRISNLTKNPKCLLKINKN
jgi:hypothetical protein